MGALLLLLRLRSLFFLFFFFFNDTATTEIYTLSLHDALPIFRLWCAKQNNRLDTFCHTASKMLAEFALRNKASVVVYDADRKSTRLNSSHSQISYAVFCLKKKKPSQDLF